MNDSRYDQFGRHKCFLRFMWVSVLLLLCFVNLGLCNDKFTNDSILMKKDVPHMIWSQYLEDYIVGEVWSNRVSKDITFMDEFSSLNTPLIAPNMHSHNPVENSGSNAISYHSSAYKRPNSYITKRVGEAVELEPHMRPPVKIITPQFRPMTNQMIHQQYHPSQLQQQHQPTFLEQLFGIGPNIQPTAPPTYPQSQPVRPVPVQHPTVQQSVHQNFRPVSENDLYLLGAIEKLVYRVDYLESRVRRAEQLIYYLMAGNNQKEERDPCPKNFTRVSDNCYHINGQQQVNWKTANSACKALGAHLAEFEKPSEDEEIIAFLLNQSKYRSRDFWLGGLNPGLIWIWSNSAKPVNPNMNLTSIAMSNSAGNSSNHENTTPIASQTNSTKIKESTTVSILNNVEEIKGQGRCLKLSFNATKHSYIYYGQECTSRHHYICEYEDKTLDNRISKLTRKLKIFD